jgi:ABC-type glycerol-3-phosphate transport system permease component
MSKKNKFLRSKDDIVIEVIAFIVVFLSILVFLYPVLYFVSVSFSSTEAVMARKVWLLPVGFNINAYKLLFQHEFIMGSFKNSIIYVVLGTVYSLILTIFGAYALAHKELRGRNFFSFMVFFTMLFNGGLIPSYLLVSSLNMNDTIGVMVIPMAVTPWNLIIMRTMFQQNPKSLEEAAKIEGANHLQILFKIVIPISTAVIATVALFYFVQRWNDYFKPLIYLSTKTKYPLQLIAREILVTLEDSTMTEQLQAARQGAESAPETFRAAVIIFTIFPLAVIYPFLQKYFVKGITVGSVKG